MNRPPILLLALVIALCPGCLFSKKSAKPKEDPAVAAETEESFKQRFVEKRVNELVTTGVNADTARKQATDEFKARYGYTGAAQK